MAVPYRNTQSPRLSLLIDPLSTSLADGTNIPPPVHTPPDSPGGPQRSRLPSLSHPQTSLGGPLSSHPVTPIEHPDGHPAFPLTKRPSSRLDMATNDSQLSQYSRPGAPNTPPSQSGDSRSRRPSFASRFLRLRSLSSLRSWTSNKDGNSSSTSVMHHSSSIESMNDRQQYGGPRGTKRPMEPSLTSSDRYGRNNSHSFPRLVRKKSMDMLSTVKRKSGFWGSNLDLDRAMQEEAALERMREDGSDSGRDGRRSRLAEQLMQQDPAPKLRLSGLDGGQLSSLTQELEVCGKRPAEQPV